MILAAITTLPVTEEVLDANGSAAVVAVVEHAAVGHSKDAVATTETDPPHQEEAADVEVDPHQAASLESK